MFAKIPTSPRCGFIVLAGAPINAICIIVLTLLCACSPIMYFDTVPKDIVQSALQSCDRNAELKVGDCIYKKLKETDEVFTEKPLKELCKSNLNDCSLNYTMLSRVEYGGDVYETSTFWKIVIHSTRGKYDLDNLIVSAKIEGSQTDRKR